MDELQGLLRPWPESGLEGGPVSSVVNSVANDGPECLEPADGERDP
jgi:putative SOS response-associated peptidase YedK